jgi:ankyrin repeat protein
VEGEAIWIGVVARAIRAVVVEACSNGDVALIARLLTEGQIRVNQALCDSGDTMLIAAAAYSQSAVCEMLVNRGAIVSAPNLYGITALWRAAAAGALGICDYLLSLGAEQGTRNNGSAPLHAAAENGHLDVCKLLIKHGAAVNLGMNDGVTALWLAAWKGHLPVVRLLVDSGADLEIPRDNGATPVYAACEEGKLDVVEYLCVAERGVASPPLLPSPPPSPPLVPTACRAEPSSWCEATVVVPVCTSPPRPEDSPPASSSSAGAQASTSECKTGRLRCGWLCGRAAWR